MMLDEPAFRRPCRGGAWLIKTDSGGSAMSSLMRTGLCLMALALAASAYAADLVEIKPNTLAAASGAHR